jgi:hypothetical protein
MAHAGPVVAGELVAGRIISGRGQQSNSGKTDKRENEVYNDDSRWRAGPFPMSHDSGMTA